MDIERIKAISRMAGVDTSKGVWRSLWVGDDNILRRGKSGDVVQMMEDMKISASGFHTCRP